MALTPPSIYNTFTSGTPCSKKFHCVCTPGRTDTTRHTTNTKRQKKTHQDTSISSNEGSANNLFQTYWEWRLNNSPEFATSIGVHKYDHRLNEMNINSYFRRMDEAKSMLGVMKRFKAQHRKNIKADTALNINLVISELEQFLAGQQFTAYMYPLNMLEGPQLDFPKLLTQMKKNTIDDVMKIIWRMRQFPQQINEIIGLLNEGIRLGKVMHAVSVNTLPKVLRSIDFDSIVGHLDNLFREKPKEIGMAQWKEFEKDLSESKEINRIRIKQAYLKLADFIQDVYINKTRSEIGVSSLPDGEKYYAACLKFHTTTNLTPKQVHDIGLLEVKRITGRMNRVKEQVKYNGTLKDFRNYLLTDKKFKFTDADEILNLHRNTCKKIEAKIPYYFQVLPKASYQVVPVPKAVAPTYPSGYYNAPSGDGSRPGTFYVNTYRPETRRRYEVVSLSLHEAIPGHHLQASLTMESGTKPDFRRFVEDRNYYESPGRFPLNTAYAEGWGLYAEYLGEEMGLYDDPYDMFGRLSDEMFRACRLVVDTGIHAFGWSRDKAIKYMAKNTVIDLQGITAEINRYITWPGQACAYKIGEIKIRELRRKAEQKLGGKFDLKLFHHTVASMGGVPLNTLENEIDSFIKKHSS